MTTPFGSLRVDLQLPSPEGDLFEHVLSGTCWCQPLVEHDPVDGDLFIHRRSLDSPHIEAVA